MSQRTEKVESLIRQTVATALPEYLVENLARVTLTAVDVSPDLRHAIVWFDVLGENKETALDELLSVRGDIQARLAKTIATKFVPKLMFRLDAGGEYAARMERIMNNL
jgi:ribosome-binding factor A